MITVSRLRYTPVKSFKLAEYEQVEIGQNGVVDDRIFYLVDDNNQSLNQARRLPLCQASATLVGGLLTITLPDGSSVSGTTELGRRFESGWDMKLVIPAQIVEGPWSEALSDFAGEHVRLARVAEQRGGWSGFPVSLIGTPSIDALGLGPIDARRFRMLIETVGGAPFVEDTWIGRDVQMGDAVVRVEETCARCAVTTVDPDTGARDVDALRAMITAKGVAGLGIYCSVVTPGTVRVGDTVEPLCTNARAS